MEENFRVRATLRCLKLGPVLLPHGPAHEGWAPEWPDEAFKEMKNLVTELLELQALELWGLSNAQRGLLTEVRIPTSHIAVMGIQLAIFQD